jgi:hypothetical protein
VPKRNDCSKDSKTEVLQSSIARHAKDPLIKISICAFDMRRERVEEKADCSDKFVVLSVD